MAKAWLELAMFNRVALPEYRLRQAENSECGLACLAIAAWILGDQRDLSSLRRIFTASARGMTARQLIDVARLMGLEARAIRCDLEGVWGAATPAILHWKMNHYVVLLKSQKTRIKVFDPATGIRWIRRAEVSQSFTGVLVEVFRGATFQKRKPTTLLSTSALLSLDIRSAKVLSYIFLLSAALQIFSIALPYYSQFVVDQIIPTADKTVLLVAAAGFSLLAIFNGLTTLARSVVVLQLSSMIGWNSTRRVLYHLLRLPLKWFAQRELADVLSRLQGIDSVRASVTTTSVSLFIDGLMSVTLIIAMGFYSPILTILSSAAIALYLGVKTLTFSTFVRLSARSIQTSVDEMNKRIETVSAIQTIKSAGLEENRLHDWEIAFAASLDQNQKLMVSTSLLQSFQATLFSLLAISTLYVIAGRVVSGSMTLGMLFAYMAFQTQLTQRLSNIIDQAASWKTLDVYTHRVAEIVLEPTEPLGSPGTFGDQPQALVLDGVSFRYSDLDPWIFKDFSLEIAPRSYVAIVGASGCGKSTLLKLLAGLYSPNQGSVRYGDVSIQEIGPARYRSALGMVSQHDVLLEGTICENVSLFDENPDRATVEQCLRLAGFDALLRSFPMGIDTQMGGLGGSISGGQRQRILIARALYRSPKILILDEATAHLDVESERKIIHALESLNMTRIVVSHRPETIAAATTRIYLEPRARKKELHS